MGQEHKEYTWNLFAKKLTGEATPEELRELEMLLRNNPELHYPMQTITDLWNNTRYRNKKEAELAFNRHLDRMHDLNIAFRPATAQTDTTGLPSPSRQHDPESSGSPEYPWQETHPRRRPILALSFTLAGILLLGGLYFTFPRQAQSVPVAGSHMIPPAEAGNEIYTASGSRTHLTLPDGTLVWLNAGSRITYDKNYGISHREVNLTGEAFFDVAKNAQTPFLIHTTRIDIKVLGTAFNVKSYPTDRTTEATLLRGSIEVSIKERPNAKIILKPNEKLVVANDDSMLHRQLPANTAFEPSAKSGIAIKKPTYEQATGAIIETSWVDNKLIFRDEEFAELARQMERWYGITIRFADPDLEQVKFTGTFQEETIQQALSALKLTANFSYKTDGAAIVIDKN
ncbi:MAG TPA: FecR domain-containing protein [Puia sp.]|jgi:ferric-dicitrate binding protein FerR (iron transport regulator)